MKSRLKLVASTLLLCCGAAFSATETSYYNIVGLQTSTSGGFGWGFQTAATYDLYLTQDSVTCTDLAWSMTVDTKTYKASGFGGISAYTGMYASSSGLCYGSLAATPENLYTLVKKHWVDNEYTGNLTLGTDIDLGEISSTEGKCDANHKPLPYKAGKTFLGNNKTVSNLCYVSSSMTEPVGFFGSVVNTLIQDLTVEGVRIVVQGTSKDGAAYYPVGSIAGTTELVTLENVKIADVSIDAPIAGGAVGLILNSSVKKLTSNDNISITNSQQITKGYAGSKSATLNSPYSVFLGGIAGVTVRDDGAASATLEDVAVTVDVQNKAAGVRSALGGAIGFSFASLDSFSKVKVTVGSSSSISGGSAMGGLIGYTSVLYTNNSPVTADTCVVKLDQGTFKGKIGGASSPDMITVGGIVGRDSLLARSKLEIVNSTAEITLADELLTAGTFRYYAGGILGYGNNCISSNRNTDFLVIEKSKSSGTMSLEASDVAVEGLHVKTFMGGIAGAACLAMEPRGFKENSSSVVLTSKVKTTGDSLSVGGLIGTMNTPGTKGITLSNLEFTGKVVVEDSLGQAFVGGILGQFREADGGKSIKFKDVYVNAQGNVIEYKAKASTKPAGLADKYTRVGGLCAYCREVGLTEKIGIYGGISVNGTSKFVGDNLYVGGILAHFENTSTAIKLQKTYSIGDIAVSGIATKNYAGYLVGVGVIGTSADYAFRSNYHYGANETVDAFGYLTLTDLQGEGIAAGWMDNANMSYNIRNGATNTEDANANNNGTEVSAAMQTRSFAGFMNGALGGTKDDPYVWCYQTNSFDNMPFVTLKNSTPVSPADVVTYTVKFLDYDEKTLLSQPQTIPENGDAVEPEEPTREGYTFTGWNSTFTTVTSDLDVVAQYEINTYDVQFYSADSAVKIAGFYTEKVPYGETVAGPGVSDYKTAVEKEGYDFVGWSDSSYLVAVKGDLNIYPVYKEKSYKLTLVDDEDNEIESEDVPYGATIKLPESVDKASTDEFSYEFLEWNAPEGDTIPATMPAKNVVIVAKFKATKRSYTVTFLDNKGEKIEKEQEVEYGSSATAPLAPAVTGRVFAKWDDSSFVKVVKDLEVKALYDTATFVVRFYNYEKEQMGKTQTVVYEEAAVEVAAPVSEGRVFTGWSETGFDKVVKDLEIYALYDTAQFTVNFYDFDSVLVGKTQEIVYGAGADVPATPVGVGRIFKSWSETGYDKVMKNLEIYALYDTATYVVKFLDFDGVQIGKSQNVIHETAAVELAAPVSEGRVFTGWSDSSYTSVVKDLEVKALYDTAKFSVSFYDFNGKLIESPQGVVYGASAEEPAAPIEAGRVFKGWSDSSYTKVVKDLEVKALYDTALFMVVFYDYDGMQIGKNQMLPYGGFAYEMHAPESEGRVFKGWSDSSYTNVVKDLEVKALYDTAKFNVSFYDFEGKLIGTSQEVVYGAGAKEPATPTGKGRVFKGWNDSSYTKVMKDLKVTALYDTATFKVTFLDHEGNVIYSNYFKYGVDMSVATALERRDSENYRYIFKEWSPALGILTSDMVVRAVYDSTYIGPVEEENKVQESEVVVAPRSWNMISLSLMEQAGYTSPDGAFYWWDEEDPLGDYWQYKAYDGGDFDASRGYWFGTTQGAVIPVNEPSVVEGAELVWNLGNKYSGWNMVANPYGWYVELNGTTDNGDSVEFWRWNADSSGYEIPRIIRPYEAIWAKVKRPTTWRVAATPVAITPETVLSVPEKVAALRKSTLRKTSAKQWNVMVSLKDEYGKSDSWNMIGAGSQTESMEKAPVGMGDYVRLAIAEGKTKLAKSIKAVASEYEWELLVAANTNRDGALVFTGVEELKEQGLVMMVTVDGVSREVKDGSEISIALKKDTKKVSVRVVSAGAVAVADNGLKGFTALQNAGSLQLGFDAPESLAGARGHYALVAVNGKKVAGGSFTATAGGNVMNLSAPKSGLYFVQLKVGSQQMSSKILVK